MFAIIGKIVFSAIASGIDKVEFSANFTMVTGWKQDDNCSSLIRSQSYHPITIFPTVYIRRGDFFLAELFTPAITLSLGSQGVRILIFLMAKIYFQNSPKNTWQGLTVNVMIILASNPTVSYYCIILIAGGLKWAGIVLTLVPALAP